MTDDPRPNVLMREPDGRVLSDLLTDFAAPFATWGGGTHNIEVALDNETPSITFGEHEVPATKESVAALANFFKVPIKFLERVEADERQFIMERRIERSDEQDLTINWREGGILDVLKSGQRRIPAEAIVETAIKVMPEESLVIEAWSDPDDFRLDVVVPADFDHGIGGDRKLGDLTRGGLRFGQNRKQNLAPTVQKFMYRLRCTNGMEIPDLGMKIDARGDSVEEILIALEEAAQIGYDAIGAEIESFYAMRAEKIDKDVTGVLRRVAQESGLPDRTVGNLEDHLSQHLEPGEDPSMFDLINTITNLANHESLENRRGPRRQLQVAGGAIIGSHTERCNLCHRSLG
jgi:hypothetical protein